MELVSHISQTTLASCVDWIWKIISNQPDSFNSFITGFSLWQVQAQIWYFWEVRTVPSLASSAGHHITGSKVQRNQGESLCLCLCRRDQRWSRSLRTSGLAHYYYWVATHWVINIKQLSAGHWVTTEWHLMTDCCIRRCWTILVQSTIFLIVNCYKTKHRHAEGWLSSRK